jgi:2-phospho-L-lactate guanylyltransferase
VQGTVRGFDEATRSGSVFLDNGTVLEFSAQALQGSGLRLLRAGQRVRIGRDGGGAITAITLATLRGGAGGRGGPPLSRPG